MQTQASIYQIPLEDLVEQILSSRKITRAEEARLTSALSQDSLVEEQQALIHRVLYGLRHSLLQIVDWSFEGSVEKLGGDRFTRLLIVPSTYSNLLMLLKPRPQRGSFVSAHVL